MTYKLKYLLWSLLRFSKADQDCPACGERQTHLVKRKYTTALYACPKCKLMLRTPKDDPQNSAFFYESEYQQGFTTDCPSPAALEELKNSRFAGTEKDYSMYISVLQTARVLPGMSVLDFGSSWGYGSWQLKQAGYDVYSCEIGQSRARYAETMLDCKMISPDQRGISFDCFFSAHVLEHLNNPREMWEMARKVVRPGGTAIIFLPNGNLSRPNVHKTWGKVHPLLIDSVAALNMARWAEFEAVTYTTPVDLGEVRRDLQSEQLAGDELVIIARKQNERKAVCA
jgi:SAM-dependent methyltransferase